MDNASMVVMNKYIKKDGRMMTSTGSTKKMNLSSLEDVCNVILEWHGGTRKFREEEKPLSEDLWFRLEIHKRFADSECDKIRDFLEDDIRETLVENEFIVTSYDSEKEMFDIEVGIPKRA